MLIWLSVMIFILGLCCGSFMNMLVYRTAQKYKILKIKRADTWVRPYNKDRSFCDFCGRQLKWYENVPVISWMIQKGKTRCCGKKLSVLYPIVEITTGILFLLLFRSQISDLRSQILFLVLGFVVIIFLIFSAVFDLKYMILPDFSTAILLISALALWFIGNTGKWEYFFAAIGAFGFLGLLYLITKGKGMGFGDVKFAIFMGLFLGPEKTVVAFYVAFILGALISLILMILKKASKKTLIPFGPFLILGTFVGWFWGNGIWYLISSILY